jgi:hypothetical protein
MLAHHRQRPQPLLTGNADNTAAPAKPAAAASSSTATRPALPPGMRRAADVLHEIIWRLLLAREQQQGAPQ